jgi:hypothetical protein
MIHSLSRIIRNALAVMTAILFVALFRYILNQVVKSECQRPHGVGGHKEVISNGTNSISTNTCLHTFRSSSHMLLSETRPDANMLAFDQFLHTSQMRHNYGEDKR